MLFFKNFLYLSEALLLSTGISLPTLKRPGTFTRNTNWFIVKRGSVKNLLVIVFPLTMKVKLL